MLDDLDSGVAIAHHTAKLLHAASADERLPTPVDDIVAAAKLKEADESWLSDSALTGVPEYLARKMRKLQGKAQALLDRTTHEIHLSPDIEHDGQRRFKALHEVSHDLLPWQNEVVYADDGMTLSWSTRVKFEQEANQGSAELLFQRDLFQRMAAEYAVGFPAIVELSKLFGSSIHAAFRRYVETHKRPMAGIVLGQRPCQTDPVGYKRREAIASPAWAERYDHPCQWPTILFGSPYTFVEDIVPSGSAASRSIMRYPDLNDKPTDLQVEAFSNTYRVLVLAWLPQRELLKRKRVLAPAVGQGRDPQVT